jgi:hypothetical protein
MWSSAPFREGDLHCVRSFGDFTELDWIGYRKDGPFSRLYRSLVYSILRARRAKLCRLSIVDGVPDPIVKWKMCR